VAASVAEFMGVKPGILFQDPGPINSAFHWKSKLLGIVLAEAGFPELKILCERLAPGRSYEALKALLMAVPGVDPEVIVKADAEAERRVTLPEKQVEWIKEKLNDDLKRFQDRWEIDPWEAG
jgi:hypothetical protein